MLRNIKRCVWIALLAAGLQKSWGFAVLGPQQPALGAESWQTAVIGYLYAYADFTVPGGPEFLGDIGGPHNLGEEYRRNTPVLYYTYDQTFLDFFGTDGASSVDGAFAIMNALPSVDQLDVSQYPLEATHLNYRAQSLLLTDLKSVTLHLLVEQLGLADPERFVWTLHDRVVPPGCPLTTEYTVVSRNFDYQTSPLNQIQYSAYINDIFYTYWIEEFCSGPPTLAFTVPFSTDPEATPYTAVAANDFDGQLELDPLFYDNANLPHNTSGGLQIGYFYSGLTRDDVAGLKYLYTTNKVDLEYPEPTSFLFSVTTNLTAEALFPAANATNAVTGTNGFGFYIFDGNFGYGDYGALYATAQTNSPAVLQALYPGLVIATSSNYFVLATNWVYKQYFTNTGYGTTYPPPLTLVTVSNAVPYLLQKYVTTFANVFPDPFHPWRPTTTYKFQNTIVQTPVGSPYGSSLETNSTLTTKTLNQPSGDFFLLPLFHTNVCPVDILYTGLTNVLSVTNSLASTQTNIVTATNTSTYSATLSEIFYFTNYTFVTHPTVCTEPTNAANLYQGIGGVKFVRQDYDSLVGQYFQPITNFYTMVELTNSQWRTVRFTRVVTRPDILLDADDLGLANTSVGTVIRDINFLPSPVVLPIAVLGPRGPGTITTPSVFTYDKIGEASWNGYDINTSINNFFLSITNGFLFQQGETPSLAWASFDNSTNDPIVYPNGSSIFTLESILAIHFNPTAPPNGSVGASYSQTFAVGGGLLAPPLNWTGLNLPPGMSVTDAANGTDFILSGTPTTPGVYNFIVQLALTGAPGRNTQWNFTITILP